MQSKYYFFTVPLLVSILTPLLLTFTHALSHSLFYSNANSSKIALYGLEILTSIMSHDETQIGRLAKCGGCKLICDLAKSYGCTTQPLAIESIRAIATLATSNKAMLGEVGACAIVMQTLRYHCTQQQQGNGGSCTSSSIISNNNSNMNHNGYEALLHVVSLAMYNLCVQCTENKSRFAQLKTTAELQSMLSNRSLSHPTRDYVKDAMNAIKY